MQKKIIAPLPLLLASLAALLFMGYHRLVEQGQKSDLRIDGATMGTYYSVVIAAAGMDRQDDIKRKIDQRLEELNDIFSTYRPHSTIARFNQAKSTDKFLVNPELALVVEKAKHLFFLTDGAFNIALDPVIDLWGFDKSGRIGAIKPKAEQITKALQRARIDQITVKGHSLRKSNHHTSINLSGIAKGFAADDIARMLSLLGYSDFLVEIGGEMVAKGKNSRSTSWIIGIEDPLYPGDKTKVIARVKLNGMALASSGTYLNYFVDDGMAYSHIIDPRTGSPIRSALISVSVMAKDCMTADALATSALVMGEEKLCVLAEKNPNLGFMFVKEKNGHIVTTFAGLFQDNLY